MKHLVKNYFKIIVPRKRNYNYILFLELYFGETLLKKDSKIIVPKKEKELYFIWKYIW